MKRRQILFLVQLPPPVNGVSVMNQALVDSALLADCCDRIVLPILMNRELSRLGRFGPGKVLRSMVLFFRLLTALLIHRPAAVYLTMSPFGYAFYRDIAYIALIKLFRRKLILHIHGKGITAQIKKHPWLGFLYRFVLHASHVISLSGCLAADLEPVFAGQPFIVNNGIPDRVKNGLPRHDGSPRPVRLLYLSNLCRSKGVFDYLAALKLVKDKGLLFEGVIVGAEADLSRRDLDEEIGRLGLGDRVVYLGPRYGQEKYDVLSGADIFVFPTFYRNEAFPVSILEAMQFSMPVISTPEGAIPDMVDDGLTGFLVKQQDPVAIAEKVAILLGSPGLRAAMGRAGREKFVNKYRVEVFEEKMRRVFEAVLETSC